MVGKLPVPHRDKIMAAHPEITDHDMPVSEADLILRPDQLGPPQDTGGFRYGNGPYKNLSPEQRRTLLNVIENDRNKDMVGTRQLIKDQIEDHAAALNDGVPEASAPRVDWNTASRLLTRNQLAEYNDKIDKARQYGVAMAPLGGMTDAAMGTYAASQAPNLDDPDERYSVQKDIQGKVEQRVAHIQQLREQDGAQSVSGVVGVKGDRGLRLGPAPEVKQAFDAIDKINEDHATGIEVGADGSVSVTGQPSPCRWQWQRHSWLSGSAVSGSAATEPRSAFALEDHHPEGIGHCAGAIARYVGQGETRAPHGGL